MSSGICARFIPALVILVAAASLSAQPVLNDRPPSASEWGFHPLPGAASTMNPPGFTWRPQRKATAYDVQVAADQAFAKVSLSAEAIRYCVWCPDRTLAPGRWFWRYRAIDASGRKSGWSSVRSFTIAPGAIEFPMPDRPTLLARIPKQHPRLFVRPEQLPHLRELASGPLRPQYEAMRRECERLLKDPPPTDERPKYPPSVKTKSEQWRVIWWGNREYTIKVLNGAATLGFTRLLDGNDRYGQLGKRLLLEAAKWDPKGATGYRYNDEAGMPYLYFFSRAYTFLYDTLTEPERQICRDVIRVRGNEIYAHLNPRHLGSPYASHSNRAWHFLGEAGIAFSGEIPEADEWTWFAMNVFWNVYPVWSDSDGGWHEGSSYWQSYIERFSYFADVMRAALNVDAFRKPYFSQIGYYPLYLQPPGTTGGGFGDLVATRTSKANVRLMSAMAAQAQNPYWQWYVDVQGGPAPEGGYIGFVRGAMPAVQPRTPLDLPTSRVFRGTGQAALNTTLLDAAKNVELLFKSSPFGTQSHGYDANNSFLLYAFGQRLLVATGRRDIYGSDHHVNWMWETKSCNSITVNGKGQTKHSAASQGRIIGFFTSPDFDYVAGDATPAYAGRLTRFERHVLFLKPSTIVIFDRLEAPAESTFEYRLHSPTPMQAPSQDDIHVASGDAACRVSLLWPRDLKLTLTDKYDVPPRPRIKLTEWHLTAQSARVKQLQFVTVIDVYHTDARPPAPASIRPTDGGYSVQATLPDGQANFTLPADGDIRIQRRSGASTQWTIHDGRVSGG